MIHLAFGKFTAEIAPLIGGGVAAFRYDGIDLLRPADDAALASGNPFNMASFPMVPFPGRIREGIFSYDGLRVELPANCDGHPYPLHGHGLGAAWHVAAAETGACRLYFDHSADAWPWDYRAEQAYALSGAGLTMTLSVINRSSRPMPLGLGQHPYFLRGGGCRIRADIAKVLWPSDDLVADRAVPIPTDWGFSADHPVGSLALDHGFSGWRQGAEILWSDRLWHLGVTASASGKFLQIYAPPGEDFFCLEPMSCIPNAVNWPGPPAESGLISLAPGATEIFETLIAVTR